MKYLKNFSFLIAFFLGGLLFSFSCKAQALPSVDSSVFSTISSGNTTLIDVGFLPQDIVPYIPISSSNWSPWNLGYSLLSQIDIDDCTISLLNDNEKAQLLSTFQIVNVNGTTLTSNDNIYCLTYDNGYFTGSCYIDSEGKMLAYTDNVGGHLLQTRFGGSIKDASDWADMFEDVAIDIKSDQFLLTDHPEYIQDVSYYLFEGTLAYGNPSAAYDLFIPNQYNKGVIVPTETQNGYFIRQWYYNSSDAFIYHTRYGTVDPLIIETGTFNKDNVSYTHRLTLNRIWYGNTANNDFFDWLNGVNKTNCIFGAEGVLYNSNINSSTAVAFKPIQNPNGAQIINYNYYYDYNSIEELESQLNNLQNQLNNNFDYQSQLSENNFPFYYPIGDTEINPSEIPFPGVENYPGYNPMPTPSINPNLDYSQLTQPTSQEVQLSFDNFQIPFVSGLFNRYPFCIPWDIKNFINSLKAEPQAPAWDFDYSITVAGQTYTTHFEGDLSDYNTLATIFRNLLLIGFIIGLCKFSYDHHF